MNHDMNQVSYLKQIQVTDLETTGLEVCLEDQELRDDLHNIQLTRCLMSLSCDRWYIRLPCDVTGSLISLCVFGVFSLCLCFIVVFGSDGCLFSLCLLLYRELNCLCRKVKTASSIFILQSWITYQYANDHLCVSIYRYHGINMHISTLWCFTSTCWPQRELQTAAEQCASDEKNIIIHTQIWISTIFNSFFLGQQTNPQ